MIKENVVTAMAVMSLVCMPVVASSAEKHSGHKHNAASNKEEKPSQQNALIEEMLILDKTFHEVVSGVSLGDGERVHKALEAMHGTMEKTHEAVHSGAVRVKKNEHRIKDFVKMDKEFHRNLENLAHAAHKGDRNKMLSLTKKLLDGCVACHKSFR